MEDRLWIEDLMVGEARRREEWVRVSFPWLFWPSIYAVPVGKSLNLTAPVPRYSYHPVNRRRRHLAGHRVGGGECAG